MLLFADFFLSMCCIVTAYLNMRIRPDLEGGCIDDLDPGFRSLAPNNILEAFEDSVPSQTTAH